MTWLVFSFSFPAKVKQAARIRFWRKMKKLGAVSPKNGIYVLPYSEHYAESLRWIAAEIEQEQGEALLMNVSTFENLSDEKLTAFFVAERNDAYQSIEQSVTALEFSLGQTSESAPEILATFKKNLKQLKKSLDELRTVDFFPVYDRKKLTLRLHSLQQKVLTCNLIVTIFFCVGSFNTTALRKMKEETYITGSKSKLKPRPKNIMNQFQLAPNLF